MNRTVKAVVQMGLLHAPAFITTPLRDWAQKRELNRAMEIARRTRVSKEQVIEALEQFTFDCDVMLHCSMVNIGKIQGGAKFLADTLLAKVDTSQHTLIVSALPHRGAFASWLSESRTFDVRTAPVAMGAVNERLAQHPDARRSIHPTHSVVAIGPHAAHYTAEHHLDITPFGPHSPYCKLITRHAKTLLLGATQNNVTFIHAIEDLLGDAHPVNVYNRRQYSVPCIDQQGRQLTVATPVHAPWPGALRDCDCMNDLLTKHHALHTVPLGEAAVTMFDCHDYAMLYLDYLASGRSIYGKHRVTDALLQRIEQVKALLAQP